MSFTDTAPAKETRSLLAAKSTEHSGSDRRRTTRRCGDSGTNSPSQTCTEGLCDNELLSLLERGFIHTAIHHSGCSGLHRSSHHGSHCAC